MKENQKINSRLGWTQEEQQMLRSLYEKEGVKSWVQIVQKINQTFTYSKRSSKQCRQRYNNFVKIKSQLKDISDWTEEENQKLFGLYTQKGSKWVEIAKNISGRSQNYLKNRFYGSLRKALNMINRFCVKSQKKLKPIKYLTLSKILERRKDQNRQASSETQEDKYKNQFCQKLRKDLIQIAKQNIQIQENYAKDIIFRGHKFNVLTRFQNMARNRSFKGNKKVGYKPKNRRKNSKAQQQSSPYTEKRIVKLDNKQIGNEQQDELIATSNQSQTRAITLVLPEQFNTRMMSQCSLEEQLCRILNIDYNPSEFIPPFQS